jgi:hypothetical protein
MASIRNPITLIGLVTLGASLTLAVVACSSSTSGTSTGTSGGASGGTSGASGGTSGAATSGGSGPNKCAASQPAASKCTAAEVQTYSDCVTSKCSSQYSQCYGSGWQSGSYSGPCGTYLTCVSACGCTDTACYGKCTATTECSTCLQGVGNCSAGCTLPACYTAGSSGGTSGSSGSAAHTCADLTTCCGKIADATMKSSCESAVSGAAGNDATCNSFYPAFGPSCP